MRATLPEHAWVWECWGTEGWAWWHTEALPPGRRQAEGILQLRKRNKPVTISQCSPAPAPASSEKWGVLHPEAQPMKGLGTWPGPMEPRWAAGQTQDKQQTDRSGFVMVWPGACRGWIKWRKQCSVQLGMLKRSRFPRNLRRSVSMEPYGDYLKGEHNLMPPDASVSLPFYQCFRRVDSPKWFSPKEFYVWSGLTRVPLNLVEEGGSREC